MRRQLAPNAADGFVPARLKMAREARGLKRNQLAEAIKRAPATITKWESGAYDHAPDSTDVSSLSHKLQVQPSWFYKPLGQANGIAFYRSLKSALHGARAKTAAKLQFVHDIHEALDARVEFPTVDIPDLLRRRDYKTLRADDFDRLASEARDFWGLGEEPIDDLMVVIENAGIIVGEEFFESEKLDGVSKWFDDVPVMLLAKDKSGGVRRRFDAAHELAHLILHREVTENELEANLDLIEGQAMAFAGAFLLPAGPFALETREATLDAFANAKPRWKVSIAAMIKRARSLNLVTAEHERNLWKYYSSRRWWGDEPHDATIEIERPANLGAAVEMVADDGVDALRSLRNEIGISFEDVAGLTGTSGATWEEQERPRPKLTLVERDSPPLRKASND